MLQTTTTPVAPAAGMRPGSPFDLTGKEYSVTGAQLKALADLAVRAGRTAVEMRERVNVNTKSGPGDLVTCADEALSAALLEGLEQLFPGDELRSEEAEWQGVAPGARAWYIDPIDGTKHYVERTGRWSVMAGLVVAGTPVAGCISIPDKAVTYIGGQQHGTWQIKDGSGQPEMILPFADLDSSNPVRVLISKNDLKANDWMNGVKGIELITASSIGLDMHEILQGNADVFVHIRPTLKAWDTAAPGAVALGAGLEIGTEDGPTIGYGDSPSHPGCIVMGRRGCIDWWQKIYACRKS